MPRLPAHIQIYSDESLESYLLRLCQANYFDSFYDFALELKHLLWEQDSGAAGGLPTELAGINIYHAQQDSSRRSQALFLVEKMLDLKSFSLLDITFKHGTSVDLMQRATVRYQNHIIPRHYLRQDSIPICPACLQEEQPYIRYLWHLEPLKACVEHNCTLVECCPRCNETLNYIESELITHCFCGFDLRKCDQEPADAESYWQLNPEAFSAFGDCSFSEKLAVLSLLERLAPDKNHEVLLREGIDIFSRLLEERISEQFTLATKPLSQLPFRTLSAGLIDELSRVSNLPQDLISGVIKAILIKALDTPKTSLGCIGDSLLSARECAFLLQSSVNDIYRLYETGVLSPAIRLSSKQALQSYQTIFRLRDIAGFTLSCSSFMAVTSSR